VHDRVHGEVVDTADVLVLEQQQAGDFPEVAGIRTIRSLPPTRMTPSSEGITTFIIVSIWVVAESSQARSPSNDLMAGIISSTEGMRWMRSYADARLTFRLAPALMSRLDFVE
jgi:hypothetical protein